MAARALRSALGVRTTIAPLYTGGPVAVAHDGGKLFCPCGDDISVISLPGGQLVRKLNSVRPLALSLLCAHLLSPKIPSPLWCCILTGSCCSVRRAHFS